MAWQFIFKKRVEFCETDMAGIAHFSNFFRYMEMTEHAFIRSLGYSVHTEIDGYRYGWPRVRAECDYRQPVRFEDEIEVELLVAEKKEKAIEYRFHIYKAGREARILAGVGTIVSVCVAMQDDGVMKSAKIPAGLADQIETAPAAALSAG